ncbi:cation transporter [Pontibacter sp. G13]|uniref:heavy-metal-associated domain-containing protein n=1 Tax=Pontibacter sp. G13 TaxID=3074898 RepID=UPI002889C063|nr:cation transporter [Pontibacter sp. G13]WNJ20104.1 cation transporter [Pontibacter sp. G13]
MKHTFKTNINCGGCIAKVKPVLDQVQEIEQWEVDTAHPDKILTVEGALTADSVMELVQGAGFNISPKKRGLLGWMKS